MDGSAKVGEAIEVLTNERGWRPAIVDETYPGGFWVQYEGGRTCFFDGDEGRYWRRAAVSSPIKEPKT